MRLQRLVKISGCLGLAALAATTTPATAATVPTAIAFAVPSDGAPLDRPAFPIVRYAEIASDTVRTAVGTIGVEPEHIRWAPRSMPFTVPGLSTGVTARDLDGDGDVDLFVARSTMLLERNGMPSTDRGPAGEDLTAGQLYRNEGAGRWKVVDHAVFDVSISTHQWADFDADGDADLVYQRAAEFRGGGTEVFRNDGDDFVAWPLSAEVARRGPGGTAFATGDVDDDGFVDLVLGDGSSRLTLAFGPDLGRVETIVVDGLPEYLVLHVSDGVIFAHDGHPHWQRGDVALAIARDGSVRTLDGPMGHPLFRHVSRVDVDGDGRRDYFFPQSDYFGGRNALVLATADGGYRVVEEGTGLFAGYRYTNGMVWGDVDQDGRIDGIQPRFAGSTRAVRSPVFRQLAPDGDTPRFGMLSGAAAPPVDGASRGAVFFDADADGDLDLFVIRTIDYAIRGTWESTRDLFFENVTEGGRWLQVDLASLRSPMGACVEVDTGVRTLLRCVGDGGVPGTSGLPYRLHFGLGDAMRVEVTVTWPSGRREEVGTFDADQRLRFTESTDGR